MLYIQPTPTTFQKVQYHFFWFRFGFLQLNKNECIIDTKSCFILIHNGTRGGVKFVIAAQIKKNVKQVLMVTGNAPLKIRKSFIRAIARSTCILAFAMSNVFLPFFFENRCFSFKKGGIINCHPLDINRSLMLKPLSDIKLSPYSSLSSIWQSSVINRSVTQPPEHFNIKDIVPARVIQISFFHVFLDLDVE